MELAERIHKIRCLLEVAKPIGAKSEFTVRNRNGARKVKVEKTEKGWISTDKTYRFGEVLRKVPKPKAKAPAKAKPSTKSGAAAHKSAAGTVASASSAPSPSAPAPNKPKLPPIRPQLKKPEFLSKGLQALDMTPEVIQKPPPAPAEAKPKANLILPDADFDQGQLRKRPKVKPDASKVKKPPVQNATAAADDEPSALQSLKSQMQNNAGSIAKKLGYTKLSEKYNKQKQNLRELITDHVNKSRSGKPMSRLGSVIFNLRMATANVLMKKLEEKMSEHSIVEKTLQQEDAHNLGVVQKHLRDRIDSKVSEVDFNEETRAVMNGILHELEKNGGKRPRNLINPVDIKSVGPDKMDPWREPLHIAAAYSLFDSSSPIHKRALQVNVNNDKNERASFSNDDMAKGGDGKINITDSTTRETLFHELGHYFEETSIKNTISSRMTMRWREKRTENENSVKLAELYPGAGYDEDEVTKKDEFFNPYIGKNYGKVATGSEVFSMGFEQFADADTMIAFYKKDPEHFALTLGLLSNMFPN